MGKIPVPEVKKAKAWEARLLEETGKPPSMVAVEGCELVLGRPLKHLSPLEQQLPERQEFRRNCYG